MTLSKPIYHLKRRAKQLARDRGIALNQALDLVARSEQYQSWSHLASDHVPKPVPERLFARMGTGELMLMAARPRQGKTLMSLHIALQAMARGHSVYFFSLEYTQTDMAASFRAVDASGGEDDPLFYFDDSDDLSASYIKQAVAQAETGSLVIVDYLQLLDQKRSHPGLDQQIRDLSNFARERKLSILFLSQIDRSYDPSQKDCPDLADLRLPNQLDLALFDRTCFLQGDQVRYA